MSLVQQVLNLVETRNIKWIRVTSEGFLVNNEVVSSFTGIITNVKPTAVKWPEKDNPNRTPERIYLKKGDSIPAGYKLVFDIEISIDNNSYGISVENIPSKKNFVEFTKELSRSGMDYSQVTTLFTVNQVQENSSTVNVIQFNQEISNEFEIPEEAYVF